MRRATHLVSGVLLAAVLAGCATMGAGSHVERGTELTQHRTWEWAPAEERPTGDPRLDNNPMFEEHLRSAVEYQLARKGYFRTTLAGPPALRVKYHVNFNKSVDISGGSAGSGLGGSCSGDCEPEAYAYEKGTLVVDLVDARTNRVAWRGWSSDNMEGIIDNQGRMEREIDRMVAAMFERMPSAR
jgi:predicted small secreted protein